MAIASGVAKQVVIKKETAWAANAPVRTGARVIRRVKSNIDLKKETYQSEEIRADYQIADMRHGVRSIAGSLDGELAPGSYPEVFAALLRRDFSAVTGTAAQITISAQAAAPQFARSAGSFLTDGFRIGMVIRFSGWTTTGVNNNSRNFLITDIATSGLNMTGVFLDGTTAAAKAAGDSITITAPGKVTYTPASGHTDDSLAIENYYADLPQSELFLGNKISSLKLSLPPTGIAKVVVDVMGKDVADVTVGRGGVAENTAYFTTPAAAATTGVLAAVNGAVYVAGVAVALLTGLEFTIDGSLNAEPVVGSNVYPDISEGTVKISGTMTVLFQDLAFRNYFKDEVEVAIVAAFATGSGAAADFMSFTCPRVKCGGSDKEDGGKNIVQSVPFTALVNSASTVYQSTTMMVQDSLAP